MIRYVITVNKTEQRITPERVGSLIVGTLRSAAERNLSVPVTRVVMSVPAEFDDMQRNYTRKTASIAGKEVIPDIMVAPVFVGKLSPEGSCSCDTFF